MVDDVCIVCVQEWGEVAPGHQHAAESGMYGNVTGTGIGSVGDVGHGTDRVTDEDTRTTGSTDVAARSLDRSLFCRLDCLRRISKGTVDFSVFTAEDLVTATNSQVEVLLTNELRFSKRM